MILDSIVQRFLALAGININFREPGASVLSYGILDAVTNEAGLYLSNGVLYDKTGTPVLALSGGIGYSAGVGGAVTQATNKSTGVTLNKLCGSITMNNASLAAGAEAAFTLTNATIAATDVVAVSIKSGGTSAAYVVSVTATGAGSCEITLCNLSAGSLGEAVVLNFVVLKGVAA